MTFQINQPLVLSTSAKKFLQESIDRPPGSVESIESIQLAIETKAGALFEFTKGSELYGVILISWQPNTSGKQYLNINILGGKEVRQWRGSLSKFIIELVRLTDSQLSFVSRKGWEKLFPELKVIGSMYTLR